MSKRVSRALALRQVTALVKQGMYQKARDMKQNFLGMSKEVPAALPDLIEAYIQEAEHPTSAGSHGERPTPDQTDRYRIAGADNPNGKRFSEISQNGPTRVNTPNVYTVPNLMRIYNDQVASAEAPSDAVRTYAENATLFFSRGMILKGWLCKLMEWRVQGPSREHLAATEETIRGANPKNGADALVKHLTREERLAVFSKFRLISLPAGRTVISAGEVQQDLYMVLSGILKEDGAGQRPEKATPRLLNASDLFGFNGSAAHASSVHPKVMSATHVELVKIPGEHLLNTFRRYPNAQKKIRLLFHSTARQRPIAPGRTRKGERYLARTVMGLRISPRQVHDSPLVLKGFLHEISVGGLCFIPDPDNASGMPWGVMKNTLTLVGCKVNAKILAEGISMEVPGQIARAGHVVIDGDRLPCFGISLEELSPRARWALFTFVTHASVNLSIAGGQVIGD